MLIGIIDYGAGNLQSVANALNFIGAKNCFIRKPEELKACDKAVLPGVGAFSDAMKKLCENRLDEAIKVFISEKKPFLGICLGMQLLFENGYEFGKHKGLGIIKGDVVRFDENKFNEKLKIPHVGWNTLKIEHKNVLTNGFDDSVYMYFVHSYHVVCDEKFVCAKTFYGYDFVSAVGFENIFGFQPHPEKSHKNGLGILKNFKEL